MTNHPARNRITLMPLDSNLARWRWTNAVEDLSGTDWEPLALISCGGTLARHRRTGRLVEHLGNRIKAIDERKAQAALDGHDPAL